MNARITPNQLVNPALGAARCIGHEPLFDGRFIGESRADYDRRVERAKWVCGGCPVRLECEVQGRQLPRNEQQGVWGGLELPDDLEGRK